MSKVSVKLCKGCIEDLKIYNPYIDEDGNQVSLEDIEIAEVPVEQCANYTDASGRFVNQREED